MRAWVVSGVLAAFFLRCCGGIGGTASLLVASATLLFALTAGLARDPGLWRLLAANWLLRCAVTILFFAASENHWPLLRSLQLGGGYWTFAPDGMHHHDYASRIVAAWPNPLPVFSDRPWYFYLLAVVYGVFGVNPLNGSLFNAAAGALSGWLAYHTVLRVGSRRPALAAAGIVAFWPSLLIWSTQLLKEQITVFHVLAVFWAGTTAALAGQGNRTRSERLRDAAAMLLLPILGYGLGRSRTLYGFVLSVTALSLFGFRSVLLFWQQRWRWAFLYFSVAVLTFLAPFFRPPASQWSATAPAFPSAGMVTRASDALGVMQWSELSRTDQPVRSGTTGNPAVGANSDAAEPPVQTERSPGIRRFGLPSNRSLQSQSPQSIPANAIQLKPSLLPHAKPPSGLSKLPAAITAFMDNLLRFPETISSLRDGQETTAGHSRVFPGEDVSTLPKLIAFVPRALFFSAFSPMPWDLGDSGGLTGVFRSFACAETLLIWILLAFALRGGSLLAARSRATLVFLVSYATIGLLILALTVVNLGSIVRYRLPFLSVAMLLAALNFSGNKRGTPAKPAITPRAELQGAGHRP